MLHWTSRGLEIVELWFDEELPQGVQPDIVRHRQAFEPKAAVASDFYTLTTDLTLDPEALLGQVQKETRYEIRRAQEKDQALLEAWDGKDSAFFDQFVAFYQEFAAQKGLQALDPQHLRLMASAGRLDLSRARIATEAEALVYHAHYRHGGRARLLHSASRFRGSSDSGFRALVGRVNRWLHWQDLTRFKADGTTWYDWGGWYEGQEDQDRLRINQFKESFGGTALRTYNCEVLRSTKARIFAGIARLLGRR